MVKKCMVPDCGYKGLDPHICTCREVVISEDGECLSYTSIETIMKERRGVEKTYEKNFKK